MHANQEATADSRSTEVVVIPQKEDGIYKIAALAGSGKTTTAKTLLTQYQPDECWLVLVFNTDNKEEWRKCYYILL